jgi:hypothetical protein
MRLESLTASDGEALQTVESAAAEAHTGFYLLVLSHGPEGRPQPNKVPQPALD